PGARPSPRSRRAGGVGDPDQPLIEGVRARATTSTLGRVGSSDDSRIPRTHGDGLDARSLRSRDGARRPDCRFRDPRGLVGTRAGRPGVVHRLAALPRLLGGSVATTVNYYSKTDPTAVRQAFGATALFVGALGYGGYAVRRDLSFLYRIAFWLLVGLLVAGSGLIFVQIPAAYTLYSFFGLGVFGLYVVIDFNRLRRAGSQEAIPLAAGIFLDVLNIFLFFL